MRFGTALAGSDMVSMGGFGRLKKETTVVVGNKVSSVTIFQKLKPRLILTK